VVVVSVIVAWAAIFGIGHFGNTELKINDRIYQAQAAILFVALSAHALAALFAERRQSEARLAQTNASLQREQDNKLLNAQAITAAIAHEVRQPIAAIVANANVALRFLEKVPPERERVREILKRIVSAGHRASDIFDGLRILFGKDEQRKQLINLNELILEVLDSMHDEFLSHAVELRRELMSELPRIRGHKSQLHEVISNLLNNAVEAMATTIDRTRQLRVGTELRDGHAILLIEDSGPGIAPERLPEIFTAFITTKPKGMGLGLAICRMIVEHHDGTLTASSDGKNGALFQLVLPVASEADGIASVS
jgi:C4-dicarboxylate-specific signal transduction histidine kinase